MMIRIAGALLLAITIGMACAPARTPTSVSESPSEPARSSAINRTLLVIARGEPPSLALRTFNFAGGNSNSYLPFNASLDDVDARGTPRAQLAEALPQLGTDSWRVLPDGQ